MTKEQLNKMNWVDKLDYLHSKNNWKIKELVELNKLYKQYYETFTCFGKK